MSSRNKLFPPPPKGWWDFGWMMRAHKALMSLLKMQIVTGAAADVQYAEGNVTLVIPPNSPAAPSDFAGVWVQGKSYDTDEWVVIQAGPANGSYISTADKNTNDPRTGINWIQFAALTQWF